MFALKGAECQIVQCISKIFYKKSIKNNKKIQNRKVLLQYKHTRYHSFSNLFSILCIILQCLIIIYQLKAIIAFLKLLAVMIAIENLRIKLSQNQKSIRAFRSIQDNNQLSIKQSIEVSREKIDKNLKKNYQKLRQASHKQKQYSGSTLKIQQKTTQDKLIDKGGIGKDIKKHISLKRRNNFSAFEQYSTPFAKQSKKIQEKNKITLIDNKEVMEYIHLIYKTYQIKDPLNDQQNTDDEVTEGTASKSRLNFDNYSQLESLNSARTIKANNQNIAEISQFNIGQQLDMKKTTNKKNSKVLITLRAKTVSKTKETLSIQKKSNPLLVLKQKKFNKPQSSQAQEVKIQNIPQGYSQTSEEPVFRYCFACQTAIYQRNILKHEYTCNQLKVTYMLSFDEFIGILDAKIQRLISQIDQQIINISPKDIAKGFQLLQNLIKGWKEHKSMQNQIKQKKNEKYSSQYSRIKQIIAKDYYDKFELLSKLNWFTTMRQNIHKFRNIF